MGDQQYALHSPITFFLPRKLGRSPEYPINPKHGNIAVADRQYQNNLHEYHLLKNTNSALKKIFVTAIDEHWIKGVKDAMMGYANK